MMLGVGAIGAMLGYRKRVVVDHKAKLAAIALAFPAHREPGRETAPGSCMSDCLIGECRA